MMVSTKGRYALRLMIDLAQNEKEGPVSLKEISERQNISMKYLEAIVALLHHGKLVKSLRGKDGGYVLTRPAEKITVAEVMAITEGSLAPVACGEINGASCERAGICKTLPLWKNLDKLIETYLEGISILDLAEEKI